MNGIEEIIGESAVFKRVLALARMVAPTDSTVLIVGEKGTGKELIARAIHRLSLRKFETFLRVNCAATGIEPMETQLFGSEENGAVSQVGRLEQADKGTLFLDRIEELPKDLQPKLLHLLRDGEFERPGTNRAIRVSVRLICATNGTLAERFAEGQFRTELYYRLNVFPIRLPALRERADDIPLLVRHFVQRYATRMNKSVEIIPQETMDALVKWRWPGNVRELENFIERAVKRSEGPILNAPMEELARGVP